MAIWNKNPTLVREMAEGKEKRDTGEGELGQIGLRTLKTQQGRGQQKWKGPERSLKTEATRTQDGGTRK